MTDVAPQDFAPETHVQFKLEQLQHTGTFKARGAFNRIITAAQAGDLTDAGVAIASGGNAGLAVAYAAAAYGTTAARTLLWDNYLLVVEHSSAAAVAALLTGAYRPKPGERVVVVLCGVNTDITDLALRPCPGRHPNSRHPNSGR